MVEVEKKTKRYQRDLTDEEWSQLEPLRKPAKTGRRRTVDLREVVNAIRYLARSGCGWRMLPKDVEGQLRHAANLSAVSPDMIIFGACISSLSNRMRRSGVGVKMVPLGHLGGIYGPRSD